SQHLSERRDGLGCRNVVGDRRPDADDRQLLAAGRDRALDEQWALPRRKGKGGEMVEGERDTGAEADLKGVATGKAGGEIAHLIRLGEGRGRARISSAARLPRKLRRAD